LARLVAKTARTKNVICSFCSNLLPGKEFYANKKI
jgi:hypothetical protein